MSLATGIVVLFGLVSFVGGIIGYVKAKSLASLIAGSVSGVLLWLCSYGLKQEQPVAAAGALLIATLLGGRFLATWRRTHRVMPDLIMAVLGGVTLVTVGLTLVRGISH